jgi:hypothetical protein
MSSKNRNLAIKLTAGIAALLLLLGSHYLLAGWRC